MADSGVGDKWLPGIFGILSPQTSCSDCAAALQRAQLMPRPRCKAKLVCMGFALDGGQNQGRCLNRQCHDRAARKIESQG